MSKYIQQLIKNWYNKGRKSVNLENLDFKNLNQDTIDNIYDNIISLWISFNAFYCEKSLKDSDRGGLNYIISNYQNKFTKHLKNDDKKELYCGYSKFITIKENGLEEYIGKGGIINVRNYNRLFNDVHENNLQEKKNGKILFNKKIGKFYPILAEYYEKTNNLEQLLNTIYQIRCNLFHGHKSLDHIDNIRLLIETNKILIDFLTFLYKEEGIISDK